jgi:hypothetical protein
VKSAYSGREDDKIDAPCWLDRKMIRIEIVGLQADAASVKTLL